MINHVISGSSRYLQVAETGGSNFVSAHQVLPGIGNLRFNTSQQEIEVWNGSAWMILGGRLATVTLAPETIELLEWAQTKRLQEQRIAQLSAQHTGIQDLQQKLEIMIALVNQNTTNT
jgi:hypothetical protein